MRWAVDGGGDEQSYRAEITALDYDINIDPGRFTFEPPPGARETQVIGIDSSLESAYRHSANGVTSLLWREGDIVALLDTDSVTFEELLRIAESAMP